MIAVAVITYAMKEQRRPRAADHVMQLKTDIAREKDQMNVLRAEWGVLDQPSRLQALVGRYNDYLALKPLDVRQLATIADMPGQGAGRRHRAASSTMIRTGAITASAKPKVDKPARHRQRGPVAAVRRPQAPAPKALAPALAAPAQLETGFPQ